MLKQRIITALFLAAIFLASLFAPPHITLGFFALIVLLAAWEWGDMASLGLVGRILFTLLCVALVAVLAVRVDGVYGINRELVAEVLLWACSAWAILLLWVIAYPRSAVIWGSRGMRCLIGVVVLVPAWLALAYLRSIEHGALWILYAVALVACADIGAYFSGRAFGKHKLAPQVSPGKTIEGLLGGLAAVCLFALVVASQVQPSGVGFNYLLVLSVLTGLVSALGDLVESMVKRHRGIKDSGSILPGHGGVMDRADGLVAAMPVFALGLVMAAGS